MRAQFLRDVAAGLIVGISIGIAICVYTAVDQAPYEAPGTAYVGSVHIPPLKP